MKDVVIVYETLLASPGMSDTVRLRLNLPRKEVLLLAKVIEAGIMHRQESSSSYECHGPKLFTRVDCGDH